MSSVLSPLRTLGTWFVGRGTRHVFRGTPFVLQLARRDRLAMAFWYLSLFAAALAATIVVVDHAISLPTHSVPNSYLLGWGATTGGGVLLLGVLGGVCVFRSGTAWPAVVLFSGGGGLVVALGYWFGISGQMESGSALCGPDNACDTSWGIGAATLAVGSGLALAVVVTASFFVKKRAYARRGLA